MNPSEFVLGGTAAMLAGFFTNPLEVIKTRLQLQGELKSHGTYIRHYKNTLQAFYTVARNDGFRAIQKGLGPALSYQMVMNSIRLGSFQVMLNKGIAHRQDGKPFLPFTIAIGALSGCMGAFAGSPLYMIKVQYQSQSSATISVGHQHFHKAGSIKTLRRIYSEQGVKGLWRGSSGAMLRVTFGSATQLSTFSSIQAYLSLRFNRTQSDLCVLLASSFVSGLAVCLIMTPFDVICTRLYNQAVSQSGEGIFYSNIWDCTKKILTSEGPQAFYKGFGPHYIRIGPHTLLSLVFWGKLRHLYHSLSNSA